MTERERVLSVLNGNVPDKTPWFADLSYLYSSMSVKGTLDEKYAGAEGYCRFYRDLGAGICFYAPFPWSMKYESSVGFKSKETSSMRISEFTTPVGRLESHERYIPESYTWAITKHYVGTMEDLRVLRYISEHTIYSDNCIDFKKTDELWGGDGIPAAMTTIAASPLQKLIARWAGIENTVSLYMDHPDEFTGILEAIGNAEDRVYEILCDSPADYIEFPENLSSEVTGRDFYENFNMPYYIKRNKQLHEAGKFTGIHIDGTLTPCLSLLSGSGFDIAEAVTPYPAGDIHIKDLRKAAGADLIIWGGLPGILFSPFYSEGQFISHIVELLEAFPPGSGFILGVADQVPPDGLISRVRMVREIIGK
ncbi:MAG: hypothetical protein JXB33_10110 [Clostridia bacterium]|nr:hypothetical protein [Clostridia bacterium]